jgi:hypothetical protein
LQELQTRQASTDRVQCLEQLRQKLRQRACVDHGVPCRADALPVTALVDLVQPHMEREEENPTIRRWMRCVQQATPDVPTTASAQELPQWQRRAQGYRDFLASQAAPPAVLPAKDDAASSE